MSNRTIHFYAFCSELTGGVPQWVEVLPPGPVIQGRDGRSWTYEANQVIAATLAYGVDLPFDYLHATELQAPQGNEAPAAGWAKEYRVNSRGAVEARVEWTDRAIKAISNREYRYISPVFTYDDGNRIHRLSSFGLVNKPNLHIRALNFETTQNAPSQSHYKQVLNLEEQEAARMLGMTELQYLHQTRSLSYEAKDQPSLQQALNLEQQEAARMLGMNEHQYLSHISALE